MESEDVAGSVVNTMPASSAVMEALSRSSTRSTIERSSSSVISEAKARESVLISPSISMMDCAVPRSRKTAGESEPAIAP